VPLWGDASSSSTIVRVRPSAAAPVVVKGSVEDIWSLDEMISIVMVSFGKVLFSVDTNCGNFLGGPGPVRALGRRARRHDSRTWRRRGAA
jgi:hypothetical protein